MKLTIIIQDRFRSSERRRKGISVAGYKHVTPNGVKIQRSSCL